MRYWLAVGGPLFSVTVRVPKVKLRNKEQRLRERAGAHVDRNIRRFYGESERWRYGQHRNMRIAVLLNERKAVLRHKRKNRKLVMRQSNVVKWW